MNKVVKTMLITLAANLIVALLACLPALMANGKTENINSMIGAFFFIVLALLGQLIVGLVLAFGKPHKQTGQGMLLAVGVILVIGLALCSAMAFNG